MKKEFIIEEEQIKAICSISELPRVSRNINNSRNGHILTIKGNNDEVELFIKILKQRNILY